MAEVIGSHGKDSPGLLQDPVTGRFAHGNPGGPGHGGHAKQVAMLRRELLDTVTPPDMRAITAKLIQLAKGGNVAAIREVYDRTLGKPVEADLIERLEAIEEALDAHAR